MLKCFILLAAASPDPIDKTPVPMPEGGTNNFASLQIRDILLICGAALAMACVLFIWAYVTRKDRQKAFAASHGARILTEQGHSSSHGHGHGRKVRIRKRRRDHPDNMGRNPTLAEAGGLPPLRPDEPESPLPAASGPPPAQSEAPPQSQAT